MTIALEGTPVHNNATSGSSLTTGAFTTSQAAQVVLVVTINDVSVSSVSGGGLTWTNRLAANRIEEWTAPAATSVSGMQVSLTLSGTTSFITTDLFAVSGNDTSTIWDANAAVPTTAGSNPVTISTSNANDMILGGFRMQATASPTEGAGFTKISGADFQLTEYQIVSATQSGLSMDTGGSATSNGCFSDAIRQGAGGGAAAIRLRFPYGMDGTGGGLTGQNRIH